jgi:hypothetical protein
MSVDTASLTDGDTVKDSSLTSSLYAGGGERRRGRTDESILEAPFPKGFTFSIPAPRLSIKIIEKDVSFLSIVVVLESFLEVVLLTRIVFSTSPSCSDKS